MKRKICMVLIVLIIIFQALPAHAEEFQKKFVIKNEIKDCVFQVFWGNKSAIAEVKLTSPDGKVYDKGYENYNSMEGLVWITIDTAPPGEWLVSVDGNQLGKIDLEAGAAPEYMNITSFEVSQASPTEFDISWEISNSRGTVNLFLYADRKNSGYGGEKVAEFRGEAKGTNRVKVQDLDSGEYYLFLKVEDVSSVPDYKYSSSYFKIVNPNVDIRVNNLTYGMANEQIYAKWEASENTSYRFMLFKKGEAAPFFEDDTDEGWYTYPLTAPVKDIELAVAGIDSGRLGNYERFSLDTEVKLDYKVEFPDKESINSRSIIINTSFEKPLLMSIYINGEVYVEGTGKPGDYKIDMAEGENTVAVAFMDNRGNIKGEEKTYHVDTYPPQLLTTSDIDGKLVSKASIIVSGKTEPGAILKINNRVTEVDSSGSYSQRVKLLPGKNKITITAVDVAGNETSIIVIVTFQIFKSGFFYLIAASVIFIGFSAYYLVLLLKAKKKIRNGRKGSNPIYEAKEGGNADEKNT